MRLGHVIGRVTLSRQDPAFTGARFLLVQPLSREQFARPQLDAGPGDAPRAVAPGSSLVVFDQLGAGLGHVIGFTEGAEATAPFARPTPVDAYNAAIIDAIHYAPPAT